MPIVHINITGNGTINIYCAVPPRVRTVHFRKGDPTPPLLWGFQSTAGIIRTNLVTFSKAPSALVFLYFFSRLYRIYTQHCCVAQHKVLLGKLSENVRSFYLLIQLL